MHDITALDAGSDDSTAVGAERKRTEVGSDTVLVTGAVENRSRWRRWQQTIALSVHVLAALQHVDVPPLAIDTRER